METARHPAHVATRLAPALAGLARLPPVLAGLAVTTEGDAFDSDGTADGPRTPVPGVEYDGALDAVTGGQGGGAGGRGHRPGVRGGADRA